MSKNKKIIVVLSWLTVVISMLMIFSLSMQNAETSGETSKSQVESILNAFLGKENVTEEMVQSFQLPMRKIAHFGIYMLLGYALSNAISLTFSIKYSAMSIFGAFVYANFDEYIVQNISDGRGPSFIDVLIDTSGAIVGFLLYLTLIFLNNRIKARKKQQV
ncbi:MAG: VanZ family protein [Clostridia bacterium]|nr:VanZ family protein [Clostridia bacterium]